MNLKVAVVFLTIIGVTIGEGTLELTDADFSSRIGGINAALVMFHDPW